MESVAGRDRGWLIAARRLVLGLVLVVAIASCGPGAGALFGDAEDEGSAQREAEEQIDGSIGAAEGGADALAEEELAKEHPAATFSRHQVNELGVIPILMYHRVVEDPGLYDVTPEQFRAELVALAEAGYVPVRMIDVIDGNLDLPLGASPVVLTFDDASPSQFRALHDGRIDPDSAIGILTSLSYEYPGFEATGTFYIIDQPFGVSSTVAAEKLRQLHSLGYELGNHTLNHVNLRGLSADEARRELALGVQFIRDAVPGAQVRTLALPFGIYPDDHDLLRQGTSNGISYTHDAVLQAGAKPAPSPYSTAFDPFSIPRIRSLAYFDPDRPNMGSGYWLWHLSREPLLRYVSDGDPTTITFPARLIDKLDPQFADQAQPY
ncbi:MAG: polysaccharide deacetylase family protein [Nitriliruptoraceae bacterium]